MSGFAKIWTDILHDPWVQGLTLSEKGLWIWIITMIKEAGDSGQVSCPSWRGLGVACGCEGKTAERIIRKFHNEKKVTLAENPNGTISIEMPNYQYYQLVKRPGRLEPRAESAEPIPQQDSSQSRADQIRPEKTISKQTRADQTAPEQIKADQKPDVVLSDKPSHGTWSITPDTHETILSKFYKKFGKKLNEDDLKILLYGNHSFEGFGFGSLLIFALNYIRVNRPETVDNPVGLLIDFHKNPEKYLNDNGYYNWKNLLYAKQSQAAGQSTPGATHAGAIIKKIMSDLKAPGAGR